MTAQPLPSTAKSAPGFAALLIADAVNIFIYYYV